MNIFSFKSKQINVYHIMNCSPVSNWVMSDFLQRKAYLVQDTLNIHLKMKVSIAPNKTYGAFLIENFFSLKWW